MFHQLMATELIVRDLAACTAFYRDILGLEVRESESTSDSVSFQIDNVYFFLLEARGAAQMVSSRPLDFSMEGSPRVLLAAGVEDVDAAYETLSAKGVRFLRPQRTSPEDYARRTLLTRKAISGRSTNRSTGSLCSKLKAPPHGSTVLEARSRQL
ncbi:MAG: VOC family protein [Chloroflexota bacterium]|nr:VOC family protein [Chloroflexota bacterium]